MTTLFNKKQDVIDFQLTPLGKKHLREGTFEPSYYAFGDSDVTYDTRFFGVSGSQNQTIEDLEIKDRPRVVTYPTLDTDKNIFKDKFYKPSILGNSQLGNNLYPAFELKLYSGKISGSISYTTSTFLNEKVPTVNIKMKCKFNNETKQFEQSEYLLLELNEINGLFERENFDFSILKRNNPRRVNGQFVYPEKQLYFTQSMESNVAENPLLIIAEPSNSSNVEYWFQVTSDENMFTDVKFDFFDPLSDSLDINNQNQSNIYLRPENDPDSRDC
jgi:hypothetical protein